MKVLLDVSYVNTSTVTRQENMVLVNVICKTKTFVENAT